jgi:hypothetical protein
METRIAIGLFALTATAYHAAAREPLELDTPANSIGYSTQMQRLYATVPSSAGLPYGNRLIEISPTDAQIVDSVFVGSEPGPLAISTDAPVAYVGIEGAAAVRRVDLMALSAGIQFTVGSSLSYGPMYPTQIAVMPGASGTIAVSRHIKGVSPDYAGVAIFDDGVMRPTTVSTFFGPTALAFGSTSSTLFGYDGASQWTAYKLAVDASGVNIASTAPYLFNGFDLTIVVDNGLIYATSGETADGAQMQLVGAYDSSGPLVVDDARQQVAFVHGSSIEVFDRDTFVPIFSVEILAAQGNPLSATGCGPGCIGVAFDSGQIFVLPDIEKIFADGFE